MAARTEFEQRLIEAAWDNRWYFSSDMNQDGLFTIADIGLMLKYVFFAPGDFLILAILRVSPEFSQFFEMSLASVDGWLSIIFTFFLWTMSLFGTFCDY